MRAVIASVYSPILTILDAIRRFQLSLSSIDEMVIHFLEFENNMIGSEDFFLFEEIMHQLPKTKTLVLKFVGHARNMNIEGEMCNSCRTLGRKMIIHEHIECVL